MTTQPSSLPNLGDHHRALALGGLAALLVAAAVGTFVTVWYWPEEASSAQPTARLATTYVVPPEAAYEGENAAIAEANAIREASGLEPVAPPATADAATVQEWERIRAEIGLGSDTMP